MTEAAKKAELTEKNLKVFKKNIHLVYGLRSSAPSGLRNKIVQKRNNNNPQRCSPVPSSCVFLGVCNILWPGVSCPPCFRGSVHTSVRHGSVHGSPCDGELFISHVPALLKSVIVWSSGLLFRIHESWVLSAGPADSTHDSWILRRRSKLWPMNVTGGRINQTHSFSIS